jgi:acyl-CoA dehydrogenase
VNAAAELADYARDVIAPQAGALIRSEDFPWQIWQELGEAGWLGFGLGDWGGIDATPVEMFDTAAAFAEAAEVVGLCSSWMGHHMIAGRVIAEFGSEAQKEEWLPDLAQGRISPCIAISEPGAGAHPKHLKTRAERSAEGWRLNGEKAWLTNGPIAGVFVVVAITGAVNGRKSFGAFLVPEDAEGVTRTEGVRVDFLKPSGHCGLKLDNVELPGEALLAEAGDAVETVLKRFRRVEDCMGLAIKTGGMAVELRRLAPLLEKEQAAALGGLAADRDLYHAAARQLMADCGGDPASPEHEARLLALRRLGRRFQEEFNALLEPVRGGDGFLDLLARDMTEMGKIAARVDAAKLAKRGAAMTGAAG